MHLGGKTHFEKKLVPLADYLDCVLLSGVFVRAAAADGEAALSQSAVLQVHLIIHVERGVLHRRTVDQQFNVFQKSVVYFKVSHSISFQILRLCSQHRPRYRLRRSR